MPWRCTAGREQAPHSGQPLFLRRFAQMLQQHTMGVQILDQATRNHPAIPASLPRRTLAAPGSGGSAAASRNRRLDHSGWHAPAAAGSPRIATGPRSGAMRVVACRHCRVPFIRGFLAGPLPGLTSNTAIERLPQPRRSLCAARICASTAATAVMLTTRRGVEAGVRMCADLFRPIRIGPIATPSVITRTML